MAGIPEDNRVIIDCDEYKARFSSDERICDYIVLCCTDDYRVAVVEMKSGAPDHVRNAIDQIQGVVKVADELIGAKPVQQYLAAAFAWRRDKLSRAKGPQKFSGHFPRQEVPCGPEKMWEFPEGHIQQLHRVLIERTGFAPNAILGKRRLSHPLANQRATTRSLSQKFLPPSKVEG